MSQETPLREMGYGALRTVSPIASEWILMILPQ